MLCFGDQRETGLNFAVTGIAGMPELFRPEGGNGKVVDVLGRNIAITGLAEDADIVHCLTWYPYLAGRLIIQFLEIPMSSPFTLWSRSARGSGSRSEPATMSAVG